MATFMGLPLPPGWHVVDDAFGSFDLIDNDGLAPHCSGMEIYNRIVAYWNLHPETANEQHRKSNQAPRNPTLAQHPAGNAGRTAPGGPTAAARPITRANYAAQITQAGPGGVVAIPPGLNLSQMSSEMERYRRLLMAQAITYGIDYAETKPLPRTSPTLGELIGHRAWKVEGGNLLRSFSAGSAWFPGQPMQDKVGKNQEIDDHNSSGVWAFKDPYDLAHQFWSEIDSGGVFGTVWMWGTVIEHERGYRAQYAAIRSLDRAAKGIDLEVLRAAYLPKTPH
jgi:hypothetical protein